MNIKISAVILAGGRGQRLDGRDKGLEEWLEKPLITHVLSTIESQVDQIVISANRNLPNYRNFGHPVYYDHHLDFQGPLAGVHAALPHLKHTLSLICPCDTPRLPPTLVQRLLSAMRSRDLDACYPICEQQRHYLPVLVKTEQLSTLASYLEKGKRSVKDWLRIMPSGAVEFSRQEGKYFININTEIDKQQCKERH